MSRDRPVLVAPDKFKGTLDAGEVAAAIGARLLAGGVEDEVALMPVADGGEGTMEAIVRAAAGGSSGAGRPTRSAARSQRVRGARRRPRRDRRAGAGLGAVAVARGRARRGGGVHRRHRRVDRGRDRRRRARGGRDRRRQRHHRRRPGALEALGGHFTRRDGRPGDELPQALRGVRLSLACDVRIDVRARRGAARVFGPQKGASPTRWSSSSSASRTGRVARRTTGATRRASRWRAPAVGWPAGCGRSPAPRCDRARRSCSTRSASTPRCANSLAVVTGEGGLDQQTLRGKAVFEVATRCRQGGVPCYAVVGADRLDAFEHRLMNVEVEAAARDASDASPSERDVEWLRAARLARRSWLGTTG